MGFQIKQAVRQRIFTKTALMAPSGGGKTYSALRLATGMAKEIEKMEGKKVKILLANTESERGYYYANEFNYDIVDINAPHEPEKYIELINFAESEGYDILILDSSSHEWEGRGGCLEIQQTLGGRYQDWGKVTPRHDKFINTIASAKMHVIATMRGKDQYVMSQSEGKNGYQSTKVEKVGVGAKQREGFEYEFTCTFLLDQKTNTAESFKDNTHIFENEPATKLTEKHGERIIQWANTSKLETPKRVIEEPILASIAVVDEITKAKANIKTLVTKLTTNGVTEADIKKAIKTHHNVANYNSVKDIEIANKIIEELRKLEV